MMVVGVVLVPAYMMSLQVPPVVPATAASFTVPAPGAEPEALILLRPNSEAASVAIVAPRLRPPEFSSVIELVKDVVAFGVVKKLTAVP